MNSLKVQKLENRLRKKLVTITDNCLKTVKLQIDKTEINLIFENIKKEYETFTSQSSKVTTFHNKLFLMMKKMNQ